METWQHAVNSQKVYLSGMGSSSVEETWVWRALDDQWVAAYQIMARPDEAIVAEVRVFPREDRPLTTDQDLERVRGLSVQVLMSDREQVAGVLVSYAADEIVIDHETAGLVTLPRAAIAQVSRDRQYPPGEWSAWRMGDHASVPNRGLTRRVLSKVSPAAALLAFRELVRRDEADRAAGRAPFFEDIYRPQLGEPDLRLAAEGAWEKTGRRGRPPQYWARVAADYQTASARDPRRPIVELARIRKITRQRASNLVREARARGILPRRRGAGR